MEMFPTVNDDDYTFDSRMGARYMTLTHSCNTPWAEAAQMEEGGSQFISSEILFSGSRWSSKK